MSTPEQQRARQALAYLDNAVGQLTASREAHVKLQSAVDELAAFIAAAKPAETTETVTADAVAGATP